MTDRLLTRSITALRFPLSIGIVLLHTIIVGQSYPYSIEIEQGQYLFLDVVVFVSQREIGDIAVPLFFFISGFLFFYKVDFSLSVYKIKLKKRIRSLLIPYVLWNTLWLTFTWVCYMFIPSLMASTKVFYDNFCILSLIDGYIGYCNGPLLAPLWFVRDLIFINLFAYPLFYLLKNFGKIIIPLLGTLFLLKIGYETSFIGIRSWSMYAFGAWFAINKKNVLHNLYPYKKWILVGFVILVIVRAVLYFNQIAYMAITVVGQMQLLVGMFSFLLIAAYCTEILSNTYAEKCAKASFFLYASHMFIINLPNRLWVCILPVNALTASFVQLTIPIVVSVILYYVFEFFRKFFPHFIALLIGGRF